MSLSPSMMAAALSGILNHGNQQQPQYQVQPSLNPYVNAYQFHVAGPQNTQLVHTLSQAQMAQAQSTQQQANMLNAMASQITNAFQSHLNQQMIGGAYSLYDDQVDALGYSLRTLDPFRTALRDAVREVLAA